MSSGISVGTYPGPGDDAGPTASYRASVDGSAAGMAGVHSSVSYGGPGTGSAYYPFVTGSGRNYPDPETSQRHQDTGAGHQSSCSVIDTPGRRHVVSARYPGSCDGNMSCGGGIYQQCGQQQQHQHAQMMDPNFVCPVWTSENGYTSYVVDPRTGATIARSALFIELHAACTIATTRAQPSLRWCTSS